ncbi:hypothetical protein HNQ59_001946 [Chitinivorax tropicus]|uniref:GTPase n=1 Tax=Chitinivorax tropicus TaxID=714531 RepID=A0A840MMF4_9PROT|nr:hypothetical protein [Chitinivorax tropicus]MBB5018655.1 hypothetical protein [Chitinivorax tropicus]
MFDFKGLISALLRRPPSDGVHNLKSATIWVQELPQGDIHQAQIEIVKTISALNANPKLGAKERFKTILYLDEKAQALQTSLCDDYIADTGFGRHYLPTIMAFWSEMANAYKTCLRQYVEKPIRSLSADLPLITVRGLYHFSMIARWHHLRYLPVDARIWRNLHRLYLFSETEGFANEPIKRFPDQLPTTTSQTYLAALMLDLAAPTSLLPTQILQVSTWLESWAQHLTLDSQVRPYRQLFAVNLEESKPARKLRRNMVDTKYRYWSTDTLIEHIEHVIEQIRQGELPARLGLGESFRLPGGLDLLETIANRWSREGASATRKHERQPEKKNIQVIHGFQETLEQLRHPERFKPARHAGKSNAGFEIVASTMPAMPEREAVQLDIEVREWKLENASPYGIGASFTSEFDDDLVVGDLIGLKPEEQTRFAIGIVRRIQKDKSGNVYAGIETINHTPILVELHAEQLDDAVSVAHSTGHSQAIYLPEADGGAIPRCLLLPADHFASGKIVQMRAQGKAFTIKLKPAIEQTTDYARAPFAVLAKHVVALAV